MPITKVTRGATPAQGNRPARPGVAVTTATPAPTRPLFKKGGKVKKFKKGGKAC